VRVRHRSTWASDASDAYGCRSVLGWRSALSKRLVKVGRHPGDADGAGQAVGAVVAITVRVLRVRQIMLVLVVVLGVVTEITPRSRRVHLRRTHSAIYAPASDARRAAVPGA